VAWQKFNSASDSPPTTFAHRQHRARAGGDGCLRQYDTGILAPHMDAAFDRGFLTAEDDGTLVVSGTLGPEDRRRLGLDGRLRVNGLADGHREYLAWHRVRVFRSGAG